MHATYPLLRKTDFPPIRRKQLDTLQVNLGYLCNQSCVHCHVNAGPTRTEMMSGDLIDLVLEVLFERNVTTLDLTGGAPELNPHFRRLVSAARAMGVRVIDRCNLTILSEPGQATLAAFLADAGVEVTASMPCYSRDLVDRQRGDGVFDKSIAALQQLNRLGYGQRLPLNLVYNPQGATLPPNQQVLEAEFKHELATLFGVHFSKLYVIANMPIQRFGSTLVSKGTFHTYMALLRSNFSAANLEGLMCRTTISVDYQGNLYDCDFNQMLVMPAPLGRLAPPHLSGLVGQDLEGQPIAIGDHCYGCTAGQGSSCQGALAPEADAAGVAA